jgi:L-aspartate oxidase
MKKYDVLIIGAGVAGLYTAMNLPKSKKVLVVCKDIPWECNTFYAQGGMVTAEKMTSLHM